METVYRNIDAGVQLVSTPDGVTITFNNQIVSLSVEQADALYYLLNEREEDLMWQEDMDEYWDDLDDEDDPDWDDDDYDDDDDLEDEMGGEG